MCVISRARDRNTEREMSNQLVNGKSDSAVLSSSSNTRVPPSTFPLVLPTIFAPVSCKLGNLRNPAGKHRLYRIQEPANHQPDS